MSSPNNPPGSRLLPPETVWRPDSNGEHGRPAGSPDGHAVLIDSGEKSDGSTWQVGELNTKLLRDPHFAKERTSTMTTIADTRLAGRVKASLSELSEASGRDFMGKIRSLAGAIKRLFTFTHPSAPPVQPATGDRLSYQQTLEAVSKSSSSPEKTMAYLTLDKMNTLHESCEEIPEMTKRLPTASRGEAASMLQPTSDFEQVIFGAENMVQEADGMNNVFVALSHKSGIGFEKKSQLETHVQEAVATIGKVLKQAYVPSNPKLQNLFAHGSNPFFGEFRNLGDNPYEKLSSNRNFTKADDRELRAWISQGLQVIDKASQTIAAAVINQDDSISAAAEYSRFAAAGQKS